MLLGIVVLVIVVLVVEEEEVAFVMAKKYSEESSGTLELFSEFSGESQLPLLQGLTKQ
jgi:hypothetical protein